MQIAGRERLLPTTMVGNYPNPIWYSDQPWAVFPDATGALPLRARPGTPAAPEIGSQSREAFYDAVAAIVHDQEEAGLDVIADGRVYGGSSAYGQILYHYYERLNGFELPTGADFVSPRCTGPVSLRVPLHTETLAAVRRATDRPVKVSYTGLQVLTLFAKDEHYGAQRELGAALAAALNEDFRRLADAGVDIIQIDEFLWSHGVSDWEIELLNRAVAGVPTQFWVHVCRTASNRPRPLLVSGGRHGFKRYVLGDDPAATEDEPAGPLAALWPTVLEANVQVLNAEALDAADLASLRDAPWPADVVAGVIDVRTEQVETASEVAARIRAVLEVVPAKRLGLTTSCGLVKLHRDIARAKLDALVAGAALVRAEIKNEVA
ncbi:MAG TPA: 2-hydroxypropyl-CoM lyase [Sporichthyaceae bacterium]|jgi:5-methyltetrahydropteroyltriglutamate--homocysteine methyltransferase